jgi:hypothetical protein
MNSSEQKPGNLSWFCTKALLTCLGAIFLCLLFIKVHEEGFSRRGVSEVVAQATFGVLGMALAAAAGFLLLLVVVLPIEMLERFQAAGYKVSLKSMFLITTILALLFAIVGYAMRGG